MSKKRRGFSLEVSPENYKTLQELAKKEKRSVAKVIELLIETKLNNEVI